MGDRRTSHSTPCTGRLYVNHCRLTSLADLDDTFAGWVQEGYLVGRGDHLRPRR